MRSNKGITLVALVITIIVLLILAGVSISLVVGDNGVLTQASKASKDTDVAKAKEAVEQAISSAQGAFVDVWSNNTTKGFVTDYLSGVAVSPATKSTFEEAMGASSDSTWNWHYSKSAKMGSIKVNGVWYTFSLAETTNKLGATVTWAGPLTTDPNITNN